MVKRVNKLTDEQQAQLRPHAAKWIEWGLSTAPADRAVVEDGMRRCYEFAGIPWHGNVVWVSSPWVAVNAGPIAAHILGSGAVHGAVNDAVSDAWFRHLGGRWWVGGWYWGPAYTEYFRHVCDLELPGDTWAKNDAWIAAQSAGWWWPHKDFVIVADTPEFIHRERVGPDGWGSHRLHCASGPAIRWRDGWALWFWHGRNVPQWVVESPTPEKIAAEPNIEIRRCAIESLGWDRYIASAGLAPVASDVDENGLPRELYDVPEHLWGARLRLVVVTNGSPERDGTRRRYGLTVPTTCNTPSEAVAWSYDLAPSEYAAITART